MINILHILPPGAEGFRGIDAYLLSYYRVIDKEIIHFDFAFCGINTMKLYVDDDLLSDSRFFELNVVSNDERNSFSNWEKLYKSIYNLANENHYDIIEVHSASPIILAVSAMALKKTKSKIIAHAHSLPVPTKKLHIIFLSTLCTWIAARKYDYCFACSYEAGVVFGKIRKTNKFCVINNAIDCKKYVYNNEERQYIRKKHDIEEKTSVVGYVARLEKEKNHQFLIDVFDEFQKKNPDSILWLVGEGSEREVIEKKINDKGLERKVFLFGERKDVPILLQGMDAFVVPSFREGLCIAAIESQAACLPTIVSTGIPDACCVTDLIKRIPLDEGAQKWAEIIDEQMRLHYRNTNQTGVINHGFDLESAARKLQEFYAALLKTTRTPGRK